MEKEDAVPNQDRRATTAILQPAQDLQPNSTRPKQRIVDYWTAVWNQPCGQVVLVDGRAPRPRVERIRGASLPGGAPRHLHGHTVTRRPWHLTRRVRTTQVAEQDDDRTEPNQPSRPYRRNPSTTPLAHVRAGLENRESRAQWNRGPRRINTARKRTRRCHGWLWL
jgi:hypothetical protein